MSGHWYELSGPELTKRLEEAAQARDQILAENERLRAINAELLAACEEIMEFLSNGTPVHPGALVQASVFNAIAKAKGEST